MDYKLLKLSRMIKLLKLRLPSRLYKLISDGGGEEVVLYCLSVYNFEKIYVVVAWISYFAGNTEGNHRNLSCEDS